MALDQSAVEDSDIAIIGMAAQIPGAPGVTEYWDNLCRGVESIRRIPEADLIARGESRARLSDPNYVPSAAVLEQFDEFDAEFFGLSPKEAAIMDPQHRKFLETCWHALEDAAHAPERFAGNIGVWAGCGMGSYYYWNVCSNRDLVDGVGHFLLRHTGNDKDFLSTRVSHVFDLKGPSISVQTACSSSLVAIHMACQSLQSGECDMALAGGVTIELPHGLGYLYKENEILSPDGHCHAFDHRAQGTVFGSGAAVVTLRRLRDALADGDHIWAVIKGSAINNDGAAKAGYLAPSVEGQAQAVAEALAMAGLASDSIGYVECHGTGTALGDPIEVAALNQAYARVSDGTRQGPCRIGSVKTNIGHLDTAAGSAGLIKSALAVHHGKIPPSLGYEAPNPAIDFEGGPFQVNDRLSDWPVPGPRRAGVNSLGVGGTNAHVIVQEPPLAEASGESDWPFHIVAVSGRSKAALDANSAALAGWLRANPAVNMADLSFTLTQGRRQFDRRRVLVAETAAEAARLLADPDPLLVFDHQQAGDPAEAVFMLPGGGAQYAGMARGLYQTEPVFREWMDRGLDHMAAAHGTDLRALWLPEPGAEAEADRRLLQPSLQLPLLMITEYALAQLWISWGVTPAALIGHSMGENTAACIAGVMSFEDCIGLVRLRGLLFDRVPAGGMLSVPLAPEEFAAELAELELDLAAVNGPGLSVVSGPDAVLDRFAERMAAREVECQRIAISIAAHSRLLDGILDEFRAYLASIPLNAPQIPIVSNRTGQVLTAAEATSPDYWVAHLRGTVRFADGIAHLAQVPGRVFLEVGPGRAMQAMAKAHPAVAANQVISTLRHRDHATGDDSYFMAALARFWACGGLVDWDQVWGGARRRRLSLPGYAFQRKRYFIERATHAATEAAEELARIEEPADWGWRPAWKLASPAIEIGPQGPMVQGVQNWLVFADELGLAGRVTDALRSRGQRVAVVEVGDTFADKGQGRFTLPVESDREGYEMLLAALVGQEMAPDRILHLWSVTQGARFRPGSSLLNSQLERGFFGLLHLAQAIGAELPDAKLEVIAVCNDALRVADEPAPVPEKATATGPIRVMPHEMPNVRARLVDVRLPAKGLDALAANLLEEALAPSGAAVAAWRDGRRFEQSLERVALADDGMAAIPQGAACLITGGFGGIGQAIARELAQRGGAKLALTTRGRVDSPAVAASVRQLESLGAEVLAIRADVTSPEDMARAVAETRARFGRLDVVLHAAGVIRDSLIAAKTDDEAWDVLAPKLLGTRALAHALDENPVGLTVLFSSTSSVIAPAGQADYVAANEYLNAVARSAPQALGRVVAVNWGVWADAGMAARAMGLDTASAVAVPQGRPLLDESLPMPGGREFRTALKMQDWIIGGHKTAAGQALMPGTGWIELVAEAALECGLSLPLAIRDLEFRRPVLVSDTALVSTRVSPEGDEMRIEILDDPQGEPNVSALVAGLPEAAPEALQPAGGWDRDGQGAAIPSAQEGRMAFGPRWKVLRRFRITGDEGVAELSLDPEFAAEAGEWLAHPALLDIATGWAMQLIKGWTPEHLWVPMGYGSIRLYAPLPAQVTSRIRNAGENTDAQGMAQFDITLAAPDGGVVAEIKGFALRKLAAAISATPARSQPPRSLSPAERRLHHNISQGIPAAIGPAMLSRAISTGLSQVYVSSLALPALIAEAGVTEDAAPAEGGFERPDLDSDFVAPAPGIQAELAAIWSELLGIAQVGAADSFFDLGGHSLIAVRMFGQLRKKFGVDLPISTLFEAPTIAELAALVEERTGPRELVSPDNVRELPVSARPRFRFLVDMGGRGDGTPFFMVAGMFGNIMNLRQLAQRLGPDRRFWGIQARGLLGDDKPHEDLAEAARDYIEELRQVQPEGPYLIGGFSGGGLTAYEMARQLRAAGEEVAMLVMLDTPLPLREPVGRKDRLMIRLGELREGGPGFVWKWLRDRVAYEFRRRSKAKAVEAEVGAQATGAFHDLAIEAAFLAALPKMRLSVWDGPVAMFRPPLDKRWKVTGGRWINSGRDYVVEDNGWTPWMPDLRVIEVPGDHDSMVLEPNVRRLASVLREILRDADADAPAGIKAAE
ncbi:type I polyketide synthase [Paracoccus denitrificans]|jgi:acyl transferase domain-containing protein/thioesterase domain-containing protein/acyl carrier protein|uniref:Beta-ketoacyl synthase n=1 Tax=Paracoccus denitrificans (strain Pd 1222) TaxID=318586 RepID=A1B0A4_PARDP|nr:type I polyketide synthase [Paracoccus denitrificans]ABL68948.1 beta-ketoacyl synthase [Paracoccus denitrificans PD1222]MBB4625326.1 acyl transferase domain-containing protein/thioesterase domain-containing protein/acyl carrier protein [Paracoccus denitrificans]MCU7428152.1 type I polyketide synthase [Paracoccus denitrificans]QAR26991.1 type I polyketide synthase [Paracoccus denitrificans]UPV95951.1 type I polyketide synthase [Paracoccus denitrificans]